MAYDGWFTGSKRVGPNVVTLQPSSLHAAMLGAGTGGGFHDDGVSVAQEGGDAGRLVPASVPSKSDGGRHSFTLDHQHTLDVDYTCPKVGVADEYFGT